MALPLLIGAAALGALKAGSSAHAGNKQNAFLDAADEAERQRENLAANLYEAPQLHGAEQRKTFGNNMALGFLGNFGRNASTGGFRAPWFEAMSKDAWKYRPIDSLMAKHPTTVKGPKRPKTSVLGSGLMGAAQGGLQAWMAGGGGNPFGGGGGAAAGSAFNPSAGFGAPTLNNDYFKFVMPGQGGSNPFLNP